VKSRLATVVVIVAVLAATGALLGRVVAPAWTAARQKQPALQLNSSAAAAGQGVTLALLGGFRALVGDGAWIRMWARWERRDLPAVETLIRFVTAIDPRPVYFWLNGARIMAYDFAAWRIADAGGEALSPAVEQRIRREQARVALHHLDAAARVHPESVDLWVERANIQLNALKDYDAAAESYRHAWEMPGGPYYAARLHAEMLRRAGRKAEALAWLVQLHPQLPRNDEAAAADVVLERIRELEHELGVPADRAYRPRG
jgi:hypothetical protein